MTKLQPIKGDWYVDFVGDDYQRDELPATAEEGDTCQTCWPGGSGWYQDWYEWRDGAWRLEGSTAPWQLRT